VRLSWLSLAVNSETQKRIEQIRLALAKESTLGKADGLHMFLSFWVHIELDGTFLSSFGCTRTTTVNCDIRSTGVVVTYTKIGHSHNREVV
jgi:hypothetical protein